MSACKNKGGCIASVRRVREVRERLLVAGIVMTPDQRMMDLFPVAIGPDEGAELLQRVVEEGARRTLEVGLGFAISTLSICEGLLENGGDGGHLAMDPYQVRPRLDPGLDYGGVGLRTLEDAGVRELVEFHEEESQIILPRLLAEGRRFDLAFIDGNHRFEAVFLDLIYTARVLEERKVVFVDDSQLPAVRRAVAFCEANLGWVEEASGSEGEHEWLVMRTGPAGIFDRPFARFVEF
jgi:predicted O-methyltransferase YrrM